MDTANEKAQSGSRRLGHDSANDEKVPETVRYTSQRSPYIEVDPEEPVLVLGWRGLPAESVPGRALYIGDRFRHAGRLYRVVRRTVDYGAAAREVGYAPVSW